jgi:Antitoxin VbhA
MSHQPCRDPLRWPELFEPLDDAQREHISEVLAKGRLEGWDPGRDEVADLIDHELGRIDAAEYALRTASRLARERSAPESS